MNDQSVAVVYARSATDNRDGIRDQILACREYAQSRRRMIIGEFVDLCVSGNSLDNRPGLNEALTVLRTGQVLLLADIDRLARDYSVLKTAIRKVHARGACVAAANGSEKFIPFRSFRGNGFRKTV